MSGIIIVLIRSHTCMTSSRLGERGQIENGQNSDGSGQLQERGGDPQKLDVYSDN